MAKNRKPTIGVVAISKNEATDMPGFLQNLIPWMDEIVVVDDESTDGTCDIVRAAGEKVRLISNPLSKETGFAGQRNCGLEAISTDWVLNMDIDERVPPEFAREIQNRIATTDLNAFRYRRLNFFIHRPMRKGGWDSWNNPQLARRGRHYYKNKVHEECVVDGGEKRIGQLNEKIWHLNDETYLERMSKSFQYCQLEADKLRNRHVRVTAIDLFFKPLIEFIKKYAFKRGFVDGIPGLISAIHSADAVFRTYALRWDEENRIERSAVEKKIMNKEIHIMRLEDVIE